MNNIQIKNVADCVPLFLPHSLYLKPVAKINISVALPGSAITGKSISNWDVMENLRNLIKPDSFAVLRVNQHSSINRDRFRDHIYVYLIPALPCLFTGVQEYN